MSRTGGMHARHLVPQSYFWNGLLEKAGLADNVPSIPLTEAEHLRILHPELDTFSAATGMGQGVLQRPGRRPGAGAHCRVLRREGPGLGREGVNQFARDVYAKVR